MKFEVLTLFPEAIASFAEHGLLGKAIRAGHIQLHCVNYREYSQNKHNRVDDMPYGGGAGMVIEASPVLSALSDIEQRRGRPYRVMLSPSGEPFTQEHAKALAAREHVAFLCGRYEGIDDRVREQHIDACYSLGDFVLNGGEVAALAMIESVARLVPGVLGNPGSLSAESFAGGQSGALLEYPQYTRPENFEGADVPGVLLSGDHQRIGAWRQRMSLLRTWMLRPELRAGRPLQVLPTGTLACPAELGPEKLAALEALAKAHNWELCRLQTGHAPGAKAADLRRLVQRKRRQGREIALLEYRPHNWLCRRPDHAALSECWSRRCLDKAQAARLQWIIALESICAAKGPLTSPLEPVIYWPAELEGEPPRGCANLDLALGVAAAPLGIDLALSQRMIESPESAAPWAAICDRVNTVLAAHASMVSGAWRPLRFAQTLD